MHYQISFDGALPADLAHLLRSVEMDLNAQGLHLQAQTTGATGTPSPTEGAVSTGTNGTTHQCSCPPGKVCLDSIKIGHDCVSLAGLLVVTALVTAAVVAPIAYMLGKNSARQTAS